MPGCCRAGLVERCACWWGSVSRALRKATLPRPVAMALNALLRSCPRCNTPLAIGGGWPGCAGLLSLGWQSLLFGVQRGWVPYVIPRVTK